MQFEGFDVQTLEERSGVSKHAFIPKATQEDVCLFCQSHESCVRNEPLIHTSGLHCKCRYFVHISCQATCAKKCEPDYNFICLFCNKPELKEDEEDVDEDEDEEQTIQENATKNLDDIVEVVNSVLFGCFLLGIIFVLYYYGCLVPLERFIRAYCSWLFWRILYPKLKI